MVHFDHQPFIFVFVVENKKKIELIIKINVTVTMCVPKSTQYNIINTMHGP